ncbi:MAG TPA: glucokinase [Candidatus Paceibacterota bacterium]|nr:glucokinase [Candidatus Paceibacterota bacterium]
MKNKKIDIYLVGDVSATNVLIEIFGNGLVKQFSYNGQEIYDFKREVLEDSIRKSGIKFQDITRMVFAAACPTDGKFGKMTNAPFSLNINDYWGIDALIMNDFEGVSEGISGYLSGVHELKLLPLLHLNGFYGNEVDKENIGVIGAGTGLGEGRLFFSGGRYKPKSSEGGHKDLPINPRNKKEIEIATYLSLQYYGGRIPHSESVLSGRGTKQVFDYLLARNIVTGDCFIPDEAIREFEDIKDKSEAISRLAKKYPDSVFSETDEFFNRIYGRACRNVAVHEKAIGGLYIAGGIMRKNIETKQGSEVIDSRIWQSFMEEFDNGATHREWVNQTPVNVILDKEVGLKGAKYVAQNIKIFNEKLN